jgi:hypothetical protein
MTNPTPCTTSRNAIVIIGGNGGLIARYRETVERLGFQFAGYEKRMPNKGGPSSCRIALVIVIVTMVSHSLLSQARALAGDPTRIVYLKSPSISALRQTVEAAAKGVYEVS